MQVKTNMIDQELEKKKRRYRLSNVHSVIYKSNAEAKKYMKKKSTNVSFQNAHILLN